MNSGLDELAYFLTLGGRRYPRNASRNFACDNIVAGDPAVFVVSILKFLYLYIINLFHKKDKNA